MPLQIIHQDITTMACDAIVNPTDSWFSGGGGTDLAIHKAAGSELDKACRQFSPIDIGETASTAAFLLPCRYIIHTMGPVWRDGNQQEAVLLRSCYINALITAKQLGAASIAFPLISSGTFGFPKDKVLRIATSAVSDFLFTLDSEMMVYICVLDRNSFQLSMDIALKEHLSSSGKFIYKDKALKLSSIEQTVAGKTSSTDTITLHSDSFAVSLLKLIDKKGMGDVACYKKANVNKNTFWKINNDPKYRPSKPTVIAFAIALELTLEETETLLRSAGFALAGNNYFDVIIEFYISRGIYDIYEINSALYQYGQACLGC